LALALLFGAFFFWVKAHRPKRLLTTAPPSSAVLPAAVHKSSIAVLPFKNLGGDPEQAYFSDGMTNDIIGVDRFLVAFSQAPWCGYQKRSEQH
jgi:hypothetical protein